jgi:hypothetical protein
LDLHLPETDVQAIKEFSQSRLHYQNLQEKHRLVTRQARGTPKGNKPAGAQTALRDPFLTAEELEQRQQSHAKDEPREEEQESKKDPLALIRREIAVMKKLE